MCYVEPNLNIFEHKAYFLGLFWLSSITFGYYQYHVLTSFTTAFAGISLFVGMSFKSRLIFSISCCSFYYSFCWHQFHLLVVLLPCWRCNTSSFLTILVCEFDVSYSGSTSFIWIVYTWQHAVLDFLSIHSQLSYNNGIIRFVYRCLWSPALNTIQCVTLT